MMNFSLFTKQLILINKNIMIRNKSSPESIHVIDNNGQTTSNEALESLFRAP